MTTERHRRPSSSRVGPHDDDPWPARLAFHILAKAGPWWVTLWLLLFIGGLVALVVVAGPWVPGAITAAGTLVAGGAAVAKRLGGGEPATALDPPLP